TRSDSVQSSLTFTNGDGLLEVHADMTNAYPGDAASILSWTRDLEFQNDALRVHDRCSVAPGVQPVFQLHVPAQPVMLSDGSIQAGSLRILLLQPANPTWVAMPSQSPDYSGGYRIQLTIASGCEFFVELRAQS